MGKGQRKAACKEGNDNKTRNVWRGACLRVKRGQPTRTEGERIRNRHEKYSRSRPGQGQGRGGTGLCSGKGRIVGRKARDTASCSNHDPGSGLDARKVY